MVRTMNTSRTRRDCSENGCRRQGHPGRGREHRQRSRSVSTPSACKNTEDNRRDYRELMFRTTPAMRDYISGVILFDETIRQKAKDGTPLVDIIAAPAPSPASSGCGAKPLAFCPGETITEGLDGLGGRLKEYYKLGARFAKVARRDRHRGRYSQLHRDPRERPCPRPLCGAVPGKPDRPDRRAGSAHGRRPRYRAVRNGHRVGF